MPKKPKVSALPPQPTTPTSASFLSRGTSSSGLSTLPPPGERLSAMGKSKSLVGRPTLTGSTY